MARLSQRAMNNVVIFAMLAMIALFNLNSFLPQPTSDDVLSVIGSNDFVLKIEQDGNVLERAGQQWRQRTQTTPQPAITPQQQLRAWQTATLVPVSFATNAPSTSPVVAVVWLAGQSQGQVYAFYPSESGTLVKYNGSWYQLRDASLSSLLPWLPEGEF
ncbi:hypothetical protein [Alteromonas sp. CYL-A6]|uniref:hypothetical protein n=1 Tax=Alteromonas nitratireducens TaxID=3390813 RepID=UPI0034A87E72